MKLDESTLQRILEAVAQRLADEAHASAALTSPVPEACGEGCTAPTRPIHSVANPIYEAVLPRLVALTSSQIAVGRAGTRFRTDLYLRAREGQADARDAVHAEVPEGWPASQGLVPLRTRCRDRQEYLLFPNRGRSLDELSRTEVEARRGVPPAVQIIVGDGLSPNAILQNGPATLAALKHALGAAGLTTGLDFYVQFARIAVADELGVLSGARATIILVGERPGLGTGDSLSLYLAVNPRIGQDNAEKNCISNVRPIGIRPEEAAAQAVAILQRSFERGVGGVALGLGWGRQ